MNNELLSFALLSFTSFISVINPLGVMPVFLSMTTDMNPRTRKKIAKNASFIAFIIIVLFALLGNLFFKIFGISTHSFRIVGGIILLFLGMDMLQARLARVKIKEDEIHEYIDDITITPLAIPLLSGPGSISNAIIMMEIAHTFVHKVILIATVFIVLGITYITLNASTRLFNILGQTGINVMMRIMGMILMVIAVNLFFSGLKPILLDIFSSM